MEVKVSIIVPNYNHARFLNQRIESVLNQSYQDFEVILLDDASTDNSLEIINTYKNHPKITHVILNKTNSGSPFIQWQKGIELAKGTYVWIAESDDFADSGFLEETVSVLDLNPDCCLAYSNSKIINKKNEVLSYWSMSKNAFFDTDRWNNCYMNDGTTEVVDYLLYKTTINNASAVLFRRNCLDAPEFLKTLANFNSAGDLYTYIYLALQGKISYIDTPLNNYREHALNQTKTNMRNGIIYMERLECFTLTLELFKANNSIKAYRSKLNKAYKYIILKNGFQLVETGQVQVLTTFIKTVSDYGIFNRFAAIFYNILFNIYRWNVYKLKGASKKVLKYWLRNN